MQQAAAKYLSKHVRICAICMYEYYSMTYIYRHIYIYSYNNCRDSKGQLELRLWLPITRMTLWRKAAKRSILDNL